MAWSAVSWAYKDLISSAKLAQMIENLRVHDHLSTDQGSPLPLAYFRGEAQVNQSIPNNAWTPLTVVQLAHRNLPGTSSWTPTISGLYLVMGRLRWSGGSAGLWRAARITVAGTAVNGSEQYEAPSGNGVYTQVVQIVPVTSGQAITVQALQDSGAALDVNINAAARTAIQIACLGAI